MVCDRGNERSRMQIFGRSGHFLRKISIRYIDIVAGLAVNNMGRILFNICKIHFYFHVKFNLIYIY